MPAGRKAAIRPLGTTGNYKLNIYICMIGAWVMAEKDKSPSSSATKTWRQLYSHLAVNGLERCFELKTLKTQDKHQAVKDSKCGELKTVSRCPHPTFCKGLSAASDASPASAASLQQALLQVTWLATMQEFGL